jgi:membrane complex biogenesis BtpA family protein
MSMNELFPGVRKPAIAMLQTPPLPGSHRYSGLSIQSIVDHVLREAEVLAEAGFDGLQLQNMGDSPSTRRVGPEVTAYMTRVAVAVRQAFPEINLSLLVNWDALATIAVAHATDASFVRVEHGYVGVSVGAWGLIEAQCYEATRFRRLIGATEVKLFADVYEPHAVPLGALPMEKAAQMTIEEGGADGLFITGGSPDESISLILKARQSCPEVPIFLGGGANDQNIGRILPHVDGVTVATWIKGGNMRNPVDPVLARRFMNAVRASRG